MKQKTKTNSTNKKFSKKETWEQIVKNNEKMIAESWKSKNPQKEFSNRIKKLYKTYKSKNKSNINNKKK